MQLQATSIYDNIRVKEAIDLFGGYYRKSVPTAEILEEVSLTDKSGSRVSALSGGQKQRLSVGLALVNDPAVLFLDEPTTGLDPQARHNIWSIVERLRDRGKTIIMTTHYMEEAEHLCQRLAIIDRGRVIAMGTPDSLISEAGLDVSIEFSHLARPQRPLGEDTRHPPDAQRQRPPLRGQGPPGLPDAARTSPTSATKTTSTWKISRSGGPRWKTSSCP